jgi:hypothetical protein
MGVCGTVRETARPMTSVETRSGGGMTAGLGADHHQTVDAGRRGLLRMRLRGDHMQADGADRPEAIEIAGGPALRGDDHRNALESEEGQDVVRALAVERDVDRERPVRRPAQLGDCGLEIIAPHRSGRDHAEAARRRDGGR